MKACPLCAELLNDALGIGFDQCWKIGWSRKDELERTLEEGVHILMALLWHPPTKCGILQKPQLKTQGPGWDLNQTPSKQVRSINTTPTNLVPWPLPSSSLPVHYSPSPSSQRYQYHRLVNH
jgi:hypothetical protein